MTMVKSEAARFHVGWKGEVEVFKANSVETFAPGLCAMLIAAMAVSVGVTAPFSALVSSVVHWAEPGPVELTQAARMSAKVLVELWGTTPRCQT